MSFCLTKDLAEKMKKAFKKGALNPAKLNNMTSVERREAFARIIGEDAAQEVNLQFEKKLLLKNQERAMYEWARDVTGLSKAQREETIAKIRKTYEDKKRRLWEPAEHEVFLNEIASDVYAKRYKAEITLEEAQMITELAADVEAKKAKMKDDFTWESKNDALEYGAAKVALMNYVSALKKQAEQRQLINPLKERGVGRKVDALIENAKISANFIAENSRAIVASVDNSFWFRQGIKTATNPKYTKLWFKRFGQSFVDIAKTLKGGTKTGDAIVDAVKADVFSRKNYLNGRYEMGTKLDVGLREEDFPTSFPQKVPVLGRLFKASEVSYESGALRLRVDIADTLYELAEKVGVDLTNKEEVGSINRLVNSLTGRGNIGRLASSGDWINKAFFSIRFFKSNVDFLTLHAGDNLSSFAKKQAAQNLMMTTVVLGAVLALTSTLWPDAVEFDPRSSDFGKIKIGDTRFDITGGMGSIVRLAARIGTQSSKSSTTGTVYKLGEGYGTPTGMDLIWNFTENKFSPVWALGKNLIDQQDFMGEPIALEKELLRITTPISVQTGIEAFKNPNAAPLLLTIIADAIGFGSTTYTGKKSAPDLSIPGLKKKAAPKKKIDFSKIKF